MREEEERSRREQQAKEEEEEGTHEEEDEGKQDEGEEEEEGEREKQQRMNKGKASSPSLSPSFVVRRLSASSWSWEVGRGRGSFLGVDLATSTFFLGATLSSSGAIRGPPRSSKSFCNFRKPLNAAEAARKSATKNRQNIHCGRGRRRREQHPHTKLH